MGIVALMLFPLSGSLYGQEAGGTKDSVAQIGTIKLCYVSPIDFPISLAGNFGEPRPNHFHCGIDVRTQGVIGKKIFSVADGYVSRLTIPSWLFSTRYMGSWPVLRMTFLLMQSLM